MMMRRTMTATWCWSVSPAHSSSSLRLQAEYGRLHLALETSVAKTPGPWISRILLQQWQWCWWKESYSHIIIIIQLGPDKTDTWGWYGSRLQCSGRIWVMSCYVSFCKVGNLKDHHGFPPRSYHSLHPCIYRWEDRCQICLHRCLPLCSCGAWQWIQWHSARRSPAESPISTLKKANNNNPHKGNFRVFRLSPPMQPPSPNAPMAFDLDWGRSASRC